MSYNQLVLLKLLLKRLPSGQIRSLILLFNEHFNLGLIHFPIFHFSKPAFSSWTPSVFSLTTMGTDHHCQALWSITSRPSAVPGMGNSREKTEFQSPETKVTYTQEKEITPRIYKVPKGWHTTPICHAKVKWTQEVHFPDTALPSWFSSLAIPSSLFYSNYSPSLLLNVDMLWV